jgi:hypothetical protein
MKTKVLLGRPLFGFWFQWRLNRHLARGWTLAKTTPQRGFEIDELSFLGGSLLSARLEKADK